MKTITLQQIVDQNREWFVVENHPRSMSCAYRGADGTRCTIGCVLPDDLYTPEMDLRGYTIPGCLENVKETGIATVLMCRPDLREFFKDISVNVLRQLQIIHDSYLGRIEGFNVYMDRELRQFANENKLNYPPRI